MEKYLKKSTFRDSVKNGRFRGSESRLISQEADFFLISHCMKSQLSYPNDHITIPIDGPTITRNFLNFVGRSTQFSSQNAIFYVKPSSKWRRQQIFRQNAEYLGAMLRNTCVFGLFYSFLCQITKEMFRLHKKLFKMVEIQKNLKNWDM